MQDSKQYFSENHSDPICELHKKETLSSYVPRTEIDEIVDGRYTTRLVSTPEELELVLRLRFDVFKKELSDAQNWNSDGIDLDEYDLKCDHLIVFENKTKKAVGTYRLNSIESAGNVRGFYAFNEFSIEDIPEETLEDSVELGRACIAKNHRNTRVLFLLWKGLASYLTVSKKRYLFGCCSIFTQDGEVAGNVLNQLKQKGRLHDTIQVKPREDRICIPDNFVPNESETIDLPILVNIYLRIGAAICGEPAIDKNFNTIDYFVIFDLKTISKKYFKMFFS